MMPRRIEAQVAALVREGGVPSALPPPSGAPGFPSTPSGPSSGGGGEAARLVIVGSNFERLPADATRHYTAWANGLGPAGLRAQRFRECTLIHPTWSLGRHVFEAVGGYPEALAEDLRFFLAFNALPRTALVKVCSSSALCQGLRGPPVACLVYAGGGSWALRGECVLW